jgi:hypothetical protein
MARRASSKSEESAVENASAREEVAAVEAIREDAAQENAEERQEELEAGAEPRDKAEAESFNRGVLARGEDIENMVEAPADDPHDGVAASPRDTSDIFPDPEEMREIEQELLRTPTGTRPDNAFVDGQLESRDSRFARGQ